VSEGGGVSSVDTARAAAVACDIAVVRPAQARAEQVNKEGGLATVDAIRASTVSLGALGPIAVSR